ncbi:hypothetical protein KW796_02860 [Candidatus Parcubacteria bacterium]|nr:hypothetical protein [Candidatus Parcubacteria bacterium]
MPEGYMPNEEEYKLAQESLTPEQKAESMEREEKFYAVDDVEALKDSELELRISEDGKEATVTGRVKDHKIVVRKFDKDGVRTFEAQIDNYDLIQGDMAKELFKKYYQIAKAQI